MIGDLEKRREILDWYHLVENLGKVGGSIKRLDRVEALLWKGRNAKRYQSPRSATICPKGLAPRPRMRCVDEAINEFVDWEQAKVNNFISYLNQHRHRIVNYDYYQSEGISIGSGTIESTIKQIGRRVKISGSQWKTENVSQVLLHRCVTRS